MGSMKDYNNGILWKEEKELRKALYASLQSVKQQQRTSSSAPGSLCPTPPTYSKARDMETTTTTEQEKWNDTDRDKDEEKETDRDTNKVKSEKVKVDRVKVDKVKVDKVKGDKVKADRVKGNKVKVDRVKGDKVKGDKKEKTKGKGKRTGKIEKGQSSGLGTSVLPTTMEMFGAPPSPDATETKDVVEIKEIKVVAIDNSQYTFNEDSGLSFDRTSSVFPDNVASPASSITELTMDESTSESIQEVVKMRGRVTTPVNTHISSHSPPPPPPPTVYKPPSTPPPPPPPPPSGTVFKLSSTPLPSGILYKQPPSTPPGAAYKPPSTQPPVTVYRPLTTPPPITVYKTQSTPPPVTVCKPPSTPPGPPGTVCKPPSTPPGLLFKTSQLPNLQPVPLPVTSVPKTRAPPPLIPIISRSANKALANHTAVTSQSLTIPPPIMSTGMSSTPVRNHTISSPIDGKIKPQTSINNKDVEHAKCSKQGQNHFVEKVHINNIAVKNNNGDKLIKSKKSKPPKLLYFPPRRLKEMGGKGNASLINHSNVVRIDTCNHDVSVLLNDKLKNHKVQHDSPKNNTVVRLKRNANRVVKNNVIVKSAVANCTRSVSDGTRNATAKQQNSKSVNKDEVTDSKNGEVIKVNSTMATVEESPSPPKKKRGRPPGSKNKRTLLKLGQGIVSPSSSTATTATVTAAKAATTPSATLTTSTVILTTSSATVARDTSQAATSSNKTAVSAATPAAAAATAATAGEQEVLPTEAKIYNAPVFQPTAEEWQDPIAYIQQITPKAQPFGMCKVIPPQGWRPECKLNDEMRFTTQIQYVHKMQKRWGPNVQQLQCIKKHLAEQGVELTTSPQIGGCELDLVRFSHTMAQYGGLQNVPDKKRWNKVADNLRIPKAAHDRLTKLDSVYCKFLLSYDMLSKEEKDKLEKQVTVERQRKSRAVAEHERNSCFTKGRSVALTQFFRVARNTMSLCFKNEPTVSDVEQEYWKLVEERNQHVAVQWGRVGTSTAGSGFPTSKSDPYAKHVWNLNNLAQNQGNLLHHLGKEPGVTVPWLKIGMLYSTEYWQVDPHALPIIEYLHTGADKIWYCIPHGQKEKFESAMKSSVPEMCILNSKNCLAKSSVMVSPSSLVEHGVAVSRVVLEGDQYLITFPGCYTSSVCCGYNVTECVYYALPSWLDYGIPAFKLTKELRVSTKFAVERLLCLATTVETHRSSNKDLCKCLLTEMKKIRDDELSLRDQLTSGGIHASAKMSSSDGCMSSEMRRRKIIKIQLDPGDKTCDICGQLCYLSMVVHDREDDVYCLQHAYNHIKKGGSRACKGFKLMYRYDKEQLNKLVEQLEEIVSEKDKSSPGRGRNSNKRRSTERDSETS
ncbi:uncharacterized protein LOC144437489 [Glandiceps talaboti]